MWEAEGKQWCSLEGAARLTQWFEELAMAAAEDYVGIFFRLTCPSKYHTVEATGTPNSGFAGASPLDGQQYLNGVWQRTRASWRRAGIYPFGMRMAEPHHDGTLHWHLMLFIPRSVASEAVEVMRHYAFEEDGDEPGAEKYRLEVEWIDPDKGSATGYIAKYIAKNVDGFGVGADHYGREAVSSALRIEAWASIWGIRQFQQIGGPSVTVYRELRRLEEQADRVLEEIRQAADQGAWGRYTELMGGAICPRRDRPLKPWMAEASRPNDYGEAVLSLRGLLYGVHRILTRIHTWTIAPIRDALSGPIWGSAQGEHLYRDLQDDEMAQGPPWGDSGGRPGVIPGSDFGPPGCSDGGPPAGSGCNQSDGAQRQSFLNADLSGFHPLEYCQ